MTVKNPENWFTDIYDRTVVALLCNRGLPADPSTLDCERLVRRIRYHSVAGLIQDSPAAQRLPAPARQKVLSLAREQAMWELRHHAIVGSIVEQLADEGIPHALMKGTALAYSVYDRPAHRDRSDTDLLIREAELPAIREMLAKLAFKPSTDDGTGYQETWALCHPDGTEHLLDIHWQVLNSPSLFALLPVEECLQAAAPLERLSRRALAMDGPHMLLHSAAHRLMHRTAPFILDGQHLRGPNRLIWAVDIRRIASSFDDRDWDASVALCSRARIGAVVADALAFATVLGPLSTPGGTVDRFRMLGDVDSPPAHYLLQSGRRERAISDLKHAGGLRSAAQRAWRKLAQPAGAVRASFPGSKAPVAFLRLRKWFNFVTGAGTRSRN